VISYARKSLITSLLVLGVVLLVAVLGARAWINNKTAVFATSNSPQNTYSVSLKGAKGRPLLIPYFVSADVYKTGQPYVADILLHEAWDAFDESFELEFPDMRWPANNVVEFYAPGTEDGNDILIVQNRSDKTLTCLSIDAVHRFLVLDLRPGASLSIKVPKTNADWYWMVVEGVLGDGTNIPRNTAEFNRRGTRELDCTYVLSIFQSGSTIETRMTSCQ
jgi:hypothetical protein